MSNLSHIFVLVTYGRGHVSYGSGAVAVCYVLPVLWMTSYLHIIQGSSTWPRCPVRAAGHNAPLIRFLISALYIVCLGEEMHGV